MRDIAPFDATHRGALPVIAMAVLAAGACRAQDGLFGVSRDGGLSRIDPLTGVRTTLYNLGVEAVCAAGVCGRIAVLMPDGRLAWCDPTGTIRRDFAVLNGKPEGWTVRALGRGRATAPVDELLAVLSPPSPQETDWLYRIDFSNWTEGRYVPVRATGLRGVEGVCDAGGSYPVWLHLILGRGDVYTWDPVTGQRSHQGVLGNGPFSGLASGAPRSVAAAGVGLWTFRADPFQAWQQVQPAGFDDLAGLAGFVNSVTVGFNVRVDYGPGEQSVHRANPSCRVRIEAAFPTSDYAMAGVRLDVSAGDGTWSENEVLPLMRVGPNPGTIVGPTVTGIVGNQLNFHSIFADPSNPIGVWEATWSANDFTPRIVGVETATARFDVYPDRNSPSSTSRLNLVQEGLLNIYVTACYPDCDTTTGVGVLDVFDFLCYQNRYAAGAPYACDCDTSTGPNSCDIFDLICFANHFAAGCP